ncbi:hypothetical protein [Amnibacterium kyonggiense]
MSGSGPTAPDLAAASTAAAPIRFTMLPGAGPACEGDDCLPDVSLVDGAPAS